MFLSDWITAYCLENEVRDSTRQQLEISARHFERYAGQALRIEDVDARKVNSYLLWMKTQGRAPDTIRSRRGNLLILWNAAYREGMNDHDPRRARRLQPIHRDPVAWTQEEVQRLYDAAKGIVGDLPHGVPAGLYWSSYIAVAWDSGLRLGDMLALEGRSMKNRFRIVQQKTTTSVAVDLHPATARLARECWTAGPDRPEIWPLWGRREQWFYRFRGIVKTAGLEGTSKFIRRATASAVWNGEDDRDAAARKLGHDSIETTIRFYIDQSHGDEADPLLPPALLL